MRNLVSVRVGLFASAFALILWTATPMVQAAARSFELEESSSVRFRCYGEGASNPAAARFERIRSELALDPERLASARGSVEVILSSIATAQESWDDAFRNAPFLGLEEHPRASFALERVTGARSLSPREWTSVALRGRLTLHGVTRPKTVRAEARWYPAARQGTEGNVGIERVQVRGTFRLAFAEHGIELPSATARSYGGEGAEVTLNLRYRHR